MDTQESFLKHIVIGILIASAFCIAILSSGCTDSDKTGTNETNDTVNKVKCGIVNAACCENNTCNSSNLVCIENKCMNFKVTNITTEKPKYTKNEQIKISVDIDSTSDVDNVSLRVYGITSRQKKHLLDRTINLNLTEGSNTQNFTVNAPPCTHGCGAKYYPGDYPLYCELSYFDKVNNISVSDKKQVNVNLY